MEFAYAGGGLGKGGKVTLYTDGKQVGAGEVPMTLAMVFSADDGCDVGVDTGAPVSEDYGAHGNKFNGKVKGVEIAIADAAENADHLVNPAEVIRIAMARQEQAQKIVGLPQSRPPRIDPHYFLHATKSEDLVANPNACP